MEWLKILWSWILMGWNWLRTDGLLHAAFSALIVVFLTALFPVWAATLITMVVGVAKEIYDQISGKGTAEWHDLICDGIGAIVGILICAFWFLCR